MLVSQGEALLPFTDPQVHGQAPPTGTQTLVSAAPCSRPQGREEAGHGLVDTAGDSQRLGSDPGCS